jgi:hypothetical protein
MVFVDNINLEFNNNIICSLQASGLDFYDVVLVKTFSFIIFT